MINKKIVIGIVFTAIVSIGAGFAANILIKKDKPVNLKAVEKAYQIEIDKQLKKQKEEIKAQYDKEYNDKNKKDEDTIDNMCLKLANTIGEYYKNNTSNINITKNIASDNFQVSFLNEKRKSVIDNENNIENIYTVNDVISILNDGKTLRDSLTFNIEYGADKKFDINNNKLLIDYLNIVLNRKITEDEKAAINIQVNMDLDELSSIKDLKNYIYNNNQIKIDNSVISAANSHPKVKDSDGNESDDITKTITELNIVTDEDNRFYKEPNPEEAKDKTNM